MNPSRWLDEDEAIALRLIGLLVSVLIAAVLGLAVMRGGSAPSTPPAGEADVSGLRIEATLDGVVKLYFDADKHAVGTVADAALATLVQGLGEDRRIAVSGFHDATGDPTRHADLAQRRAKAVHEALLRLGAPADRLQLHQPLELTGAGGDAADARRVEVVLQ